MTLYEINRIIRGLRQGIREHEGMRDKLTQVVYDDLLKFLRETLMYYIRLRDKMRRENDD
jgi:hypothetical protein